MAEASGDSAPVISSFFRPAHLACRQNLWFTLLLQKTFYKLTQHLALGIISKEFKIAHDYYLILIDMCVVCVSCLCEICVL